MRYRTIILYISLLVVFSAPNSRSQDIIEKRIDSLMNAAHARGIFNGNVLIASKGKVIYRKSIGYADGSRRTKLTPEMLFDIGSISKEFNGVGILLLQERGKLSLDDPLSRHITNLPSWADSIRLRQLINYTSGLPVSAATSDEAIRTELANLPRLAYQPGRVYAYSYSNVYLQRRIIEKVSGMSYKAFVEKHILKPLGMSRTYIDLPVTSAGMARAFDTNFNETVYEQKITGWPRMSIDDLHKWIVGVDSYKIVNKSSMMQLSTDFNGGQSSLGYARFNGEKLTWHRHHGSNYNYEALVIHDVLTDLVIILMTNTQQFKVNALTSSIQAIMKNEPYTVPKKSLYLELREKALDNLDKGVTFYREVKQFKHNDYDLASEVGDLIKTGEYLMRRQRFDDAIIIFQLGTLLNNTSSSILSSLYQLIGECYEKKGRRQLAIIYYETAIEKSSDNKNAKGVLEGFLKYK